MSDEDDSPTLPADTLAALQEFYAENQKRIEMFEKLKADNDNTLKENVVLDEDWQLSQFWYDESTVQSLVKVIDHCVPHGGKVALISCPTLFVPTKRQIGNKATVTLLEFDRRFEIHAPDFIFYDYNFPDKLPTDLQHSYDLVIADPPFLSQECISKTSETIKWLSKDKIVVCTGEVMKGDVERLLGLKQCSFQPRHRNNLANEFSCYANFELDAILTKSCA